MRHRVLIVLVLVLLVAGLFPVASHAALVGRVRNNSGKVVAKCYVTDGALMVFRSGNMVGSVADYGLPGGGWWASNMDNDLVCHMLKVKGRRAWLAYREDMDGTQGKAVREGNYWLLKDRTSSGYVLKGRVSRRCPGPLAATALWFVWLD